MVSQEEKNYDAISTSGSMLLDIEINSNISLLNKKHYYKKKNKIKPIFKVKVPKINNKGIKSNNNCLSKKNNKLLFNFEIPNFLQDKIEIKKLKGEINNYDKEEKEIFLTSKETFINSVIKKYNLPLFISKSNFLD